MGIRNKETRSAIQQWREEIKEGGVDQRVLIWGGYCLKKRNYRWLQYYLF